MSGQPLEKAEQDQARMRAPKALLATVIFCRHGATDHHPDQFYELGDGPPLNAEGEVQARTEGQPSDVAELLVVFRERQADGTWKHDYQLSNAAFATPLEEFARVFKSQHRIEECSVSPPMAHPLT